MATQTTHYNLIKPGGTDSVDISVLNGNADILDDALYATDQLAACIADEYDPAITYTVGAIVKHEGLTYRTSYASVTGAWDSTKWTEVSVGYCIKNGLDSLQAVVNSRCGSLESSVNTLFGNYGSLMGMVWNLTRSLAPQYDSTKSYAVGDVCMNQQVLCRCIGDTSGDWDNSKWETITITDLL